MLGHLVSNLPVAPVQPLRLFDWLKRLLALRTAA